MATFPPRLQAFVDDELMRAPLLVDQAIDGAVDRIRKAMGALRPQDRTLSSDVVQAVRTHRQQLVDGYVRSLRQQVAAVSAAPARKPTFREMALAPPPTLALVDEGDVAADVEISHTIEAVRSAAEYELRELQTYVAALVGDMDVTRDHNPLRAESHARALWAAAQAIPLPRGYQLAFMRHAGAVLPQLLRKAWAGASSRLEADGIEPAAHRTLILPAGSRRPRSAETVAQPDMGRIRDSLPASTDMAPRSAAADADRRASELLMRLLEALLADPLLAPDTRALLARLQPAILRAGARDAKALDDAGHPLWHFVDRIAFLAETLPEPGDAERNRVLKRVQALVDHVVGEPEQTASIYAWALERLARQQRHRFEQRCEAGALEIASLQALEDRLLASPVPPSTFGGALDVAQLDTVPAELFSDDAPPRPPTAALAWLQQRRPGDWVRMFMQGRWVLAQLLWPGERGEVFLFGDGASATTWAVRKRALLTLHEAQLFDAAEPRPLLRDAARRVMRKLVG